MMDQNGILFNTDEIDVDAINDAIRSGKLIMVPDTVCTMIGETTRVLSIKKHNRKRVDGLKRYRVESITYTDASDNYCYHDSCCGCGGDARGLDDLSDPLTSVEIAKSYYIYFQHRLTFKDSQD